MFLAIYKNLYEILKKRNFNPLAWNPDFDHFYDFLQKMFIKDNKENIY
jgi:hypothetical protein